MSISYSDPNKKRGLRQPLTKRFRSYYRGPRKSHEENLFRSQVYLDLIKIYNELESINIDMLNKLKIILDKEKDDSFTVLENDGSRSFELDSKYLGDLQFYCAWKSSQNHEEINSSPTMDSISARISRLKMKVNRLES
jgi:hypothetical protein